MVYSWQNGQWQTNQMFEVGQEFDLPVVGKQKAYMTGHDEVHSLSKNMDGADVRFWMGFGDHYINVFTVLKNLDLLSEKPVKTAEGLEVVPLKVVKAVLPIRLHWRRLCRQDLHWRYRQGNEGRHGARSLYLQRG